VVESIKAVSDLFSPVNGKVVQANADLVSDPAKINSAPHTEWMLVIEAADAKAQYDALMSPSDYESFVKTL
jgi:glycine cleavage system H protein